MATTVPQCSRHIVNAVKKILFFFEKDQFQPKSLTIFLISFRKEDTSSELNKLSFK